MEATAILSIFEVGLKFFAEAAPAIYRAIVPDGRSPEEVIADARKAVEAIPTRPAGAALDAHEARVRRSQDDTRPTRLGEPGDGS